ncbi:MAG: DEAD/DEAH box helicase [Anaerolineae bacterium]|nr:DEAD/DEAH box helicase [Anaerolineae bacterium]
MQFSDLNLIEPLLRAVREEGYTTPTPIQQQAIPHVLLGRDLLGCAQTGTGKTAAFALPILQRLNEKPRTGKGPRVLVLAPTRELAAQIGDSFDVYGRYTRVKQVTIFGGVGQRPQTDALARNPEVLIAAPGRLLDLMNQGFIRLNSIEIFVLDEADRMLDMGFIHDVRRVISALPRERQTLLFSATMPGEIRELADQILKNPQYVAVTPVASTVETIQQSVYFAGQKEKPALLRHLLGDKDIRRVLVFTRTKHGANKVVQQLERGGIQAEAIHGNKSQSAREKALAGFKRGSTRVLVATDIAARGIDVDDITHVINYDLPHEPETYVHRIGRTARAGASGFAYSFCSNEERPLLRQIERLIRLQVPAADAGSYMNVLKAAAAELAAQPVQPPQSTPDHRASRQTRDSRSSGGSRPARDHQSNGQTTRPQGNARPVWDDRARGARATWEDRTGGQGGRTHGNARPAWDDRSANGSHLSAWDDRSKEQDRSSSPYPVRNAPRSHSHLNRDALPTQHHDTHPQHNAASANNAAQNINENEPSRKRRRRRRKPSQGGEQRPTG